MHPIGSFHVQSQTLVASDPCYMPGTWCQVLAEPVMRGLWRADTELEEHGIVKTLRVFHEDHQPPAFGLEEVLKGDTGVESQVVGLFDAAHYRSQALAEPVEDPHFGVEGSEWVDMCIDKSHGKGGCGIIPHGVVCHTQNTPNPMKDGEGRSVRIARAETGLIVAVELVLVP